MFTWLAISFVQSSVSCQQFNQIKTIVLSTARSWINCEYKVIIRPSFPEIILVLRFWSQCCKQYFLKLKMRRLKRDLIFTYKVIFGLVSDACNELFIMSNSTQPTRGHAFKLYQRYSRIDSREHLFAERIVQPWNSLPAIKERTF